MNIFQVRHTVTKQSIKEGEVTNAHILEIGGALLPWHCQQLISLLHKTQAADFGVVFNNHEQTVPFNILPALLDLNTAKHSPMKVPTESNSANDTNSAHTILDTVTEDDKLNEDEQSANRRNKTGQAVEETGHFKNVQISERIGVLKEVVCTPEGFSWNS